MGAVFGQVDVITHFSEPMRDRYVLVRFLVVMEVLACVE